ncbi:UNKNOWN [Stylonychia lemnae]|uniref:SET domain-containing protein n=1 Tax=Stylonychia lemnae TaxID=5949 RepID=A0A078B851_STYLE|nr:UNKNOWN [Stylonychia lemnae]|eukprot:CDW89462.1 UNKNOWN [Stylonychia lemnae]
MQSDPFQFIDKEATQELKKDSKYELFRKWCDEQGMNLEKVSFPCAYGPTGFLIGVGARKKIKAGEWILRTPCNSRIDSETIRNSPGIGQTINALDFHQDFTLSLYFMHQNLLGSQSQLYYTIQVSNPADLPFLWNDNEIEFIQDKHAILLIKQMRTQILKDAEEIYNKLLETGCVDKFCSGDQTKENFFQQYLISWQYVLTRYVWYEFYLKYHTMTPFIESMNHTHGRYSFHQLVDSEGRILTQNTIGIPNCYSIPGFESINGHYFPPAQEELDKIISEIEIETVEETSFSIIPPEGTFFQMVSMYDLEEGEQIPYNYGHVTNKSHLINYGFIIKNNQSDCISIKIRIKGYEKNIILHRNNKNDKFLGSCKQILQDCGLVTCSNSLVYQIAIDLIKQQYVFDFGKSLDETEDLTENLENSRKRLAFEYRTQQRQIYTYHVAQLQNLLQGEKSNQFQ